MVKPQASKDLLEGPSTIPAEGVDRQMRLGPSRFDYPLHPFGQLEKGVEREL